MSFMTMSLPTSKEVFMGLSLFFTGTVKDTDFSQSPGIEFATHVMSFPQNFPWKRIILSFTEFLFCSSFKAL